MKKFVLFALAAVLLCMNLSGCTTLLLGARADKVVDSTINVITSDKADPELIAALAEYERQIDGYVAFMKEYNASADRDAMHEEYLTQQEKYGQIITGLNGLSKPGMTQADAAYYADTVARIFSKLADIGAPTSAQ